MNTKEINQQIEFNTSAHEIYEIFLDTEKHAKLIKDEAKIDRKIGGKFSVFGDYATGENLELVPDKKIVQTWRASDWEQGYYSIISLELTEKEGKTILNFTQTGVPESDAENVEKGWYEYYWEPLREQLKIDSLD